MSLKKKKPINVIIQSDFYFYYYDYDYCEFNKIMV